MTMLAYLPPRSRPYGALLLSGLLHALLLGSALFSLAQTPPAALPSLLSVQLIDPESAAPHDAPAPAEPPRPVARKEAPKPARPLPAHPETPRLMAAQTAAEHTASTGAPVEAASPPALPTTGAGSGAPGKTSEEKASPPRFDAAYLRNPAPNYPPASRRMGEEGRVLLRVHVLANGQADEVRLQQGSGFERLDEAAVEAVRRWQFVPARLGDTAVAAWVIVPIAFNLRGA